MHGEDCERAVSSQKCPLAKLHILLHQVNATPVFFLSSIHPCSPPQIDVQLESSSILWGQIEVLVLLSLQSYRKLMSSSMQVVFDTVLQRADYVAQLVDFTKNPRLMARFQVTFSFVVAAGQC